MKKFAIICLMVFSILFCVGCDNYDETNQLSLINDQVFVELNDSKTLSELGFEFDDKYSVNDFSFIYDNDFISYENFKFTFLSLGKTELIVFLKTGENRVERKSVDIEIELGTSINYEIASDEVLADIGDKIDLSSNICINESLKDYLIFKDKNDNVLNKNFDCLEVGEFNIFVDFEYNNKSLNLGSFKLCVLNNRYVENVGLDNLKTYEIFEGTSGKIDFEISPTGANVFEIESSCESFKINNKGEYEAKSAIGDFEVSVNYKNLEKEECAKVFNFKIIEKVEIENVEVYKNGNKVLGAFVGLEQYEIKITFNKSFNKGMIGFGIGVNLIEESVNQNQYTCVVNFDECCDLNFYYSNIDSFSNEVKSSFNLEGFKLINIDNLNIEFRTNLSNVLTFNDGFETLYVVDESLIENCEVEHVFSCDVLCDVDGKSVGFELIVDENYFEVENTNIKTKKIANQTVVGVSIYGKVFEYVFKIEEIEIVSIKVSGYDEKLLFNSENIKTSFEIEYSCEYSMQIKNLKVEYDEKFLNIDLQKKIIEVFDYDFDKGSNDFAIKFSIGDVFDQINICVEPKLTKVVLKDLNNQNEYGSQNEISWNKENVVSYKLILFSGENELVINFEIDIEVCIFENGEYINADNCVDYLKSYNQTMNFIEFYEGGKYLVKFNCGRFDENVEFNFNVY